MCVVLSVFGVFAKYGVRSKPSILSAFGGFFGVASNHPSALGFIQVCAGVVAAAAKAAGVAARPCANPGEKPRPDFSGKIAFHPMTDKRC